MVVRCFVLTKVTRPCLELNLRPHERGASTYCIYIHSFKSATVIHEHTRSINKKKYDGIWTQFYLHNIYNLSSFNKINKNNDWFCYSDIFVN